MASGCPLLISVIALALLAMASAASGPPPHHVASGNPPPPVDKPPPPLAPTHGPAGPPPPATPPPTCYRNTTGSCQGTGGCLNGDTCVYDYYNFSQDPSLDACCPNGFTACCGGVCTIESKTPCCHTSYSGYVPCAANQVCSYEYFDVGFEDYGICCPAGEDSTCGGQCKPADQVCCQMTAGEYRFEALCPVGDVCVYDYGDHGNTCQPSPPPPPLRTASKPPPPKGPPPSHGLPKPPPPKRSPPHIAHPPPPHPSPPPPPSVKKPPPPPHHPQSPPLSPPKSVPPHVPPLKHPPPPVKHAPPPPKSPAPGVPLKLSPPPPAMPLTPPTCYINTTENCQGAGGCPNGDACVYDYIDYQNPRYDACCPPGFTNCCGGVCNVQSETPCCHTEDGYIPCDADQVCASQYSDVGLADYDTCCPAGKNTICGGQCISQQEQVCCNMADGEDNNNYVPCAVGDICVVDYDTIGGFTCCAHAAVAPSLS